VGATLGRAVLGLVLAAVAVAVPASGGGAPVGAAGATNVQYGVGGWWHVARNPTPGAQERALKDLHTLGAKWIRLDVNWAKLEPVRGKPEWPRFDRVINAAHASNIKVLALIQRTPVWARPKGAPENYASNSPDELKLYSDFVTRFAKRYTLASNRKVQAIEIWNEPNVKGAWSGPKTGSRYVHLLSTAYKAIKAVNKATTVVTGGLAPIPDTHDSVNARTYLINLYKAGGKPYFDAVGMHPYTWPAKPSDGSPRGWGNMTLPDNGQPSMRSTMIKNGDGGKKIWNTEFGAPAEKVGEARQAVILKDAVKVWNSYSWAGVFIWMSYQDMQTRFDGMGLVRRDYSRRPSFSTYRLSIAAFKN
jgi:hypothetical protein